MVARVAGSKHPAAAAWRRRTRSDFNRRNCLPGSSAPRSPKDRPGPAPSGTPIAQARKIASQLCARAGPGSGGLSFLAAIHTSESSGSGTPGGSTPNHRRRDLFSRAQILTEERSSVAYSDTASSSYSSPVPRRQRRAFDPSAANPLPANRRNPHPAEKKSLENRRKTHQPLWFRASGETDASPELNSPGPAKSGSARVNPGN